MNTGLDMSTTLATPCLPSNQRRTTLHSRGHPLRNDSHNDGDSVLFRSSRELQALNLRSTE